MNVKKIAIQRVLRTESIRDNQSQRAGNRNEHRVDALATAPTPSILTTIPRATLRLQLHQGFTFFDVMARIPYFHALGISHLYLSPILTARSGSMHGYDVIDHSTINPELGGEVGFRALVTALREHAMGVLVDIVPNHMAIGNSDNRLWLDVLEWGHNSRYAAFFDIDWEVPDPSLKNKILAPFLGKPYGEALRAGEIRLCFDTDSGRLRAQYFEHSFPIAPTNYAQVLRLGGDTLSIWSKQFREVTAQRLRQRGDEFNRVCIEFALRCRSDSSVAAALEALLQRFNSDVDTSRALLHQLLERQHYRLSYWRNAADEINWRRFFDVIQLIGIRIQDPVAFEVVHGTLFRLYAEGLIDGVRIDHIDGLADPRTYCRRLRTRLQRLARARPPQAPHGPAYIIVEKILAPEERLPRDWSVNGTTGYSFMNDVSALLHDPNGEQPLTDLWTSLSGRSGDFDSENQRARRRILQELLAAEFNSTVLALHRIARSDLRTRDWSLLAIRRVLQELLIQFPIYRTYADARGRSNADDQIMQQALAAARVYCRAADVPLLELLNDWLGGKAPIAAPARSRQMRLRAIARFQQLTSPLAAKSVEDTAFYRHGKLLSRNEVGSNPAIFAISPNDFHAECMRRAHFFPTALLATATHDHKRGEDLRARLAVLSEQPHDWHAVVQQWRALNHHHKAPGAERAHGWPRNADEYMLYQMLVGAWPLELSHALSPDLSTEGTARLHTFCERIGQWWIKALREAKQLSSWGEPNSDYESACEIFLHDLLDSQKSYRFLTELQTFVDSIAAAGAVNGLVQTLLKLTTPGIPDIYQGNDFWDFSLVDPDNRRPVDYDRRGLKLLQNPLAAEELITDWRSGGIKQQLIAQLLHFRAQHPALFTRGNYQPLQTIGEHADHVLAFARHWKNTTLVVAVTRLPAALGVGDVPAIAPSLWGDTVIQLPEHVRVSRKTPSSWYNPLIKTHLSIAEPVISCRATLDPLPYAVLIHRR